MIEQIADLINHGKQMKLLMDRHTSRIAAPHRYQPFRFTTKHGLRVAEIAVRLCGSM
jgi:hypothetical protein